MEYFKNRQNPFENISNLELNEYFEILTQYFDNSWLDENGSNPIQILWKRRDVLSTNELFTLAYALKKINDLDNDWIKNNIKRIKYGDDNNRIGSLFEIIGLSFFANKNQSLILSPLNNPGYDAILRFTKQSEIRVSLKTFGISDHHRDFIKKSNEIKNFIDDNIVNKKINPVNILIDSHSKYADEYDWKKLKKFLKEILYNNLIPNKYSIDNIWNVIIADLLYENEVFSEEMNSYTLIISSSFHRNEEKNLTSKLEDACINMIRNSEVDNKNTINFLFIHLNESASINNCLKWTENFLKLKKKYNIAGVIFYQPLIAYKTDYIWHCFRQYNSFIYDDWKNKNNGLIINFDIPSGICTSDSLRPQLIVGENSINIDNRYIFQKGDHYIMIKQNQGSNKKEGSVVKIASGISRHLVMKVNPNEPPLIVSGIFPPEDKLLIV